MSRTGSRTKLKGKAAAKESAAAEPEAEPEEETVPQLAWRVINESTAKQLRKMTVEDVAKKLADILSLKNHEVCLREAALLDCYVAAYWHATREKHYTDEQASSFFTLLHTLIDNIKTKQLSLRDNFKEFEQIVETVGVPDSKTCSLKCFTNDVGIDAVKYISRSIFQHYRLYQYLFTGEQQEETITMRLQVETLPDPSSLDPPPLEEAMPLELYKRCLAPKPTPPKDQEEEQLDEVDAVEHKQEQASEEQISGDSETELLMKISAEELKSVLENLVESKLSALQVDLLSKLKKKEETMSTRLSKLEKNLSD